MRKPNPNSADSEPIKKPNSAKEIKYEIKNKKSGSSHDVHAPCFSYDSDEALKLDNQLCFPLYAAARKIVGEYTPFLKPLGITYTQYITFMVLWEHDNIPVGDICAKLHLDNGTVTPLLKKMESEGYITRRRDGEDERKVKICLTDAGRGMKDKVRDIPLKISSCVQVSAGDAKTLYRILYGILDNSATK